MSVVAEIEVKYVNQPKPGKRMGSVKDGLGQFYNVQPAMLLQFAPGMKCQVEYDAQPKDGGGEWRTIKKVVGNNGPSMPPRTYQNGKNPAESKQIAVLAIVKEWVGKIPVGDEAALVNAIGAAMRAYDKTLGGVQTQRRDDMDDSVEF